MINLISPEDVKVGRKRGIKNKVGDKDSKDNKDNRKYGSRPNSGETKILTKKSKKEKEDLIEKLGLKGKRYIEVKKTLRIPVHYDVTANKMDMLNRLTARITYGIRLIGELVSDVYGDTLINVEHAKADNNDDINNILKPKVIEELVKDSDIEEKTGLSSGYIQQCISKVIWMFKSHRKSHKKWKGKIERAEERIYSARDDNELSKADKCKRTAKAVIEKLRKREPSKPFEGKGYNYDNKIPCRIDYRTGTVEEGKGKLSRLWINISTLEKYKKIDIPLNPSIYHINQLKNAIVDDFEIIKGGNSKKCKDKYYIHVTITKIVEEKSINSIGGIDQGLNKSIAAVLIPLDYRLDNNGSFPREEQLLDSAKRSLLEKYDDIVASLQEAEKCKKAAKAAHKLRRLRNKRENVSIYHDWVLANKTAEFTEGSYVAIGNSKFRQTQFRGNNTPKLRKRIGKWSYSRQRKMIFLKRSEMGYRTELRDEYGTSRECCECGSKLTRRVWNDGFSYILCHSCETKKDADTNAANIIATRCRDDRLKAGMITVKNGVSL